jgi:IS605 OrfB family transposase
LSFTANTLLYDLSFPETKTSLYNFLSDLGILYGRIKRTLFRDCMRTGKTAMEFKNAYLVKYGITARQFNAVRFDLDGIISSVKEINKLRIKDLEEKITGINKWLANKENKILKIGKDSKLKSPEKKAATEKLRFAIENKKIKLTNVKKKLARLRHDQDSGKVRICFGSNKLFRKQFHLEENGYKSHNEWLLDWKKSRNNTFFSLGSKDENGGNQTCVLQPDGALRIRVPGCLIRKYGRFVTIPRVRYAYGQDQIDYAIQARTAITHRFVRDRKGWYLHSTVDVPKGKPVTFNPREIGVFAVDVNEMEIAMAETDRFGNFVFSRTWPAVVKDLSTEQTKALYGEIVKEILKQAVKAGKPLAHERLDFSKKKASLKEQGVAYARMLSGFAYSTFLTLLDRRAEKEGVTVIDVNPAFTSVIGKHNFMNRYGITPHEAAAIAIARRAQRYSEQPDSARVISSVPARTRGKHIWSFWRMVKNRDVKKRAGLRRSSQDFSGCGETRKKLTSKTTPQSMSPPFRKSKSAQSGMRPRTVNGT